MYEIMLHPFNEHEEAMAGEAAPRWTIDDLDFSRIELDSARADDNMFYLATCASFIESGSDLYTHNLIEFFRDDAEITRWLSGAWEREELQHGRALRAYVEHVWPSFDWEHAFRGFLEEYATYCKVELLAPSQALELAARCVIETGTATYYGALARAAREPVLRELASHIADDEVSHYKHFYAFFRKHRDQEGLGRAKVLATIGRRTLEMKSEDADCAIRHVVKQSNPERADDAAYVQHLNARMSKSVRTHMKVGMTLKMLMRPLDLPARLQAVVQYPVEKFMQHVYLR